MPLVFDIKIFGAEPVARRIERTGKHANDLRPVWNFLEEKIKDIIRRQFFSQGSRGSGGWAPLAQSTVERKSRLNLRPEILRATDALFEAATSGSDSNQNVTKTEDFLHFEVTGDLGTIGGMHQSGTLRMPQRKIIDFTAMDQAEFIKDIQRYVMTGKVDWVG